MKKKKSVAIPVSFVSHFELFTSHFFAPRHIFYSSELFPNISGGLLRIEPMGASKGEGYGGHVAHARN